MRRHVLAVLLAAVSFPGAAFADMGAPGFSRVPHDIVIEVESDFPGYRFWLMSARGLEPLDLVPGQPLVINGDERLGSHRNAWVIATPVGRVEGAGDERFMAAYRKEWFERPEKPDPLLSGVCRSEMLDFYGSIPFYDSRERVVDRYRLEFVPGKHVQLVWLEQNVGSRSVKAAWVAAGVLVTLAILLGFWWIVRRLRRYVASDRCKR